VLLWERLKSIVGAPTQDLKLVSAYFVPGVAGRDSLVALAEKGVKVAVLTNALEATNVAAVRAGYVKRREPLLQAGVSLFEMKRTWSSAPRARPRGGPAGSGGSSGASSLHAKTFSVDRARVFIGSFNFDPRSAHLNTELGFIIESPALARRMEEAIRTNLPARAYALRLSAAGALQWVERRGDEELVHDREPGASWWQRLGVSALSRLPIDWLL
jgi:putative cardiolipin synthase